MADVCEELLLGFLQAQELFCIVLPLCDVAAVEDKAVQPFFVLQVYGVELQESVCLVFTKELELHLLGIGPFLALLELCFDIVYEYPGRIIVKEVLPDKALRAVAQDL